MHMSRRFMQVSGRRAVVACRQASVLDQMRWQTTATNAASHLGSNGALHAIYKQQVDTGAITYDPIQVRTLQQLDALYHRVLQYKGPKRKADSTASNGSSASWWQRFTGKSSASQAVAKGDCEDAAEATPTGLYIHGGVGCGKTYLMDMFYDNIPVEKKMRVHFHHFMLDIHKRMHALRQKGHHEDPMPHLVEELLDEAWLLCFDEFQVTDVADALILRRLFSALLDRGFVMVATSNRPPEDLYKNGLQRSLFLPFIDLLRERHTILSLHDSKTDYRAVKGAHHAADVYISPISLDTRALFDHEFRRYCQGDRITATHVTTQGRKVHIPMAAISSGVCQFSFQELCERPLGAADYLAIADSFPVVFVRDIPQLDLAKINQTRRFITFVDCMYDKRVRLHCLADTDPESLFTAESGQKSNIDEVFAFDRTLSRLLEMSSEEYLKSTGATPEDHMYIGPASHSEEDDEAAA